MRPALVLLVPAVFLLALLGESTAHAACPGKTGAIYKVKIDSSPQGAAVYVGGKECPSVGNTPWTGTLPAGDFTVVLEQPGYDAATRTLTVRKVRTQQELFVPLVRRPQIEIRADADANLVGAAVSIDGENKGVMSGPLVIQTTQGRHQIEIKKDGFETLTQWIDLTTQPSVIMTPVLKAVPKPKYGTVVVEADVADAEVYIDGNKHPDNTPAIISNVIEGVHVIEVKKAPGPPWRQTVTVTASNQTKVRAELAPLLNKGVGVVRVISSTPGARAFIDGTDMGPVPVDIKDVKAGEHIIQVKAPGFQVGEQKVTVAAGGSQILKVDLNADAPADQGTLKVVSTAPGADVFIDGAAVGKVPQEKKLSAGEHPVVVRLTGFKQFEQKVRIEAGATVTVQADLKAVGRVRILSTPTQAGVIINGVPVGKTPLDTEVEVGETVVRVELPGFQAFEQTLTIEGGKTITISRELAVAGKSEAELEAEQKGLSSFGARTLPRGRSTVDLDAGFPYFGNARITVGAGEIADQFGFDATVAVRTFLVRNEIGLGGRMKLVDEYPFSAAIFADIWWGSKLFDDSQRNGVTFHANAIASLTALSNVTISGKIGVELWSDRHCPIQKSNGDFEGQDPIAICTQYKADLDGNMTLDPTVKERVETLTGKSGKDFFGRENGARFTVAGIAEIAVDQHWNVYGIFEGAPFQKERALFTENFSGTMLKKDPVIYARIGLSYKF